MVFRAEYLLTLLDSIQNRAVAVTTAEREEDMKYILCDEKGNEVKVGNDYDFADFVNAVYANDGWFFLDEKGNIVEC